MEYIIAIGIFQGLIAAILLWKSKLRDKADGILILLVASIATHLSIKFVIFHFVNDEAVRLMMNTFIGFVYGPLLYLYTQKVISSEFSIAKYWYLFLPFVVCMVGYFSVAMVLAVASEQGHNLLNWYNTLSLIGLIPMELIFAILTILKVRKHLPVKAKEYMLICHISFSFLFLGVIAAISTILLKFGIPITLPIRTIVYSVLVIICVRIVAYRYVAFSHNIGSEKEIHTEFETNILGNESLQVIDLPDLHLESVTHLEDNMHKKSQLSNMEMEKIWISLEEVMVRLTAYKDSELSLDKLAALTKQSKYHISETLNRHVGKTFYQYINRYRVEYVLEKMSHLRNLELPVNILSIAYDAGFNSKSSFNRYFKEIAGCTPSEYWRSVTSV